MMSRSFYIRSKKHLTRSQITQNLNKMTLKDLKKYMKDRPEAELAIRGNLMNRCGFHSCHGVADSLRHIPTSAIIDEIEQVINSQAIRSHYNIDNITFNIEKITIEASDASNPK